MKRRVAKVRPSPNEEAQMIREEKERRRKLRIQQVREQQRHIAMQIRQNVEQRRQHEMVQLEEELREQWERQRTEKLYALQALYKENLQLLGQGHRGAKENEPDLAAMARREEQNHAKAEERYREALKELKSMRLKERERQSQSINARNRALQAEKERSAKIARLPPPPPHPTQNIDPTQPHAGKKLDVRAFAATHFHMPEVSVDREGDTQQPSAREEALLEMRRLQDAQRDDERRREEQLEKARLRGECALRKERLALDRQRLLEELEQMQQMELRRRKQHVSQMPPQVLQPLHRRQEMREDLQREMEIAFEDMFTAERNKECLREDPGVQLVPEPLPARSAGTQDQDLDVTVDELASGTEDRPQQAGRTEEEASTAGAAEPSRAPPRRMLKKLLARIRNQRNQWTDRCSPFAADQAQSQIPERDTSIDTGSLAGEERDKPEELPGHAHSPTAAERAEQRQEEAPNPDGLLHSAQEDERRRREMELEREKQRQIQLLQELEEQRAQLERMLLEAQREREQLRTAAGREAPVIREEAPQREDEVARDVEMFPRCEGDHTRRLREYQARLLERNRTHQRSVEVARQRLEEYQRALRLRQSMMAASPPPPGVCRSPLCLHHPPPVQLLTTCAHTNLRPPASTEAPARESDVRSPPSALHHRLIQDVTGGIMERVTRHLPEWMRASGSAAPLHLASEETPPAPGEDPAVLRPRLGGDEGRRRRDLEQMRKQKETLQALIGVDTQPPPEVNHQEPEDTGLTRQLLLASLLRAIEESHGGSLSHLEEPQEDISSSSGHLPPPGVPKPPVTRVRPGLLEMMPEQHELSAIQEAETPVNTSRVPEQRHTETSEHTSSLEDSENVPTRSVDRLLWEEPDSPPAPGGSPCSGTSSGRSTWLLSGAGTPPESSEPDSIQRIISLPSSPCEDTGRHTAAHDLSSSPRPPGSDASATISTGSYITTDPEQNLVRADAEAPPTSSPHSSPASCRSYVKDVHSLFNESSVQRIIDRYAMELDLSLNAAGGAAPRSGTDPLPLWSAGHSPASDTRADGPGATAAPEPRRGDLQKSLPVSPAPSPAEDRDSFRPLIGWPADRSSRPAASPSVLERLVGQPSAHSSMIARPSGPSSAGGWESTLTRMIHRLSHQWSSSWPSGGQDFYAPQTERSTLWPEEDSQMRPLPGEPDESASRHSVASGGRSRLDPSMSSGLPPPPEAEDAGQQSFPGAVEEPEVFAAADSFHPLPAEVTHNESAEALLMFHPPGPGAPSSPEQTYQESPERFRMDSLLASQLATSRGLLQGSVLGCSEQSLADSTRPEVTPGFSDAGSPPSRHSSDHRNEPVHSVVLPAEEPERDPGSLEKGILEQSLITLVSVTDTTLQDQDCQLSADEDQPPEGSWTEEEETEPPVETEAPEASGEQDSERGVMFLEIQWGPSGGLRELHQQKRRALLQRSSCRVEELKARAALRTGPEAREQRGSEDPPAAETTPGARPPTRGRSEGGRDLQDGPRTAEESTFKQEATRVPPGANPCDPQKVVEVKISTPEQRKRDVAEMHRRTQRLYEQLEEVKHLKATRSRQEACAKNRQRAKDFQQRTLLKLRAKQTKQK